MQTDSDRRMCSASSQGQTVVYRRQGGMPFCRKMKRSPGLFDGRDACAVLFEESVDIPQETTGRAQWGTTAESSFVLLFNILDMILIHF